MKISTRFISSKKQAGLTLIELIASLSILALVIGGALSLYSSASSSQTTTQTTAEINSLKAAVKGLYQGQGTYGVAATNLNQILVNANKIPSTINVTAGTPPVLLNSFNGDVKVLANVATFTITATLVPTEICLGLLSSANGWNSITVNAVAVALPVTTLAVSTQCAAGPKTLVFTAS